jgi:tRNA(adenine34) deaminase
VPSVLNDEHWMRRALALADRAANEGEVPVGAVIVRDDKLVSEGWNQPIIGHDPTAHAEIIALRAAGNAESNYRLPGATLYVTLEPCVMCVGAITHARIKKVVYGADDPRAGAAGSAFSLLGSDQFNHTPEVQSGVLADECGKILKKFFKARR